MQISTVSARGLVPRALELRSTARYLPLGGSWAFRWPLLGHQCVENNWPIQAAAKRPMREDLGDWQLFLNVFWRHSMRSSLMSITGNAGRHGHSGRRKPK